MATKKFSVQTTRAIEAAIARRAELEELLRRRREAASQDDGVAVAKLNREIRRLQRLRFPLFTRSFGPLPGSRADLEPAQSSPGDSERPEDISVDVYLDTDDALTTLMVIKATQRIAHELGYETPQITSVERGSIIANFKAAWSSQRGQEAIAASKAKAREIVEEAEQYGRLLVQEKQAAVDAVNVSSAVELMKGYADVKKVAVRVGAILFVKYLAPDGEQIVITRTLSTREVNAYQKSSTIGANPELVEQNLAILVAQDDDLVDSE